MLASWSERFAEGTYQGQEPPALGSKLIMETLDCNRSFTDYRATLARENLLDHEVF